MTELGRSAWRYWETLRHLKPVQIGNRLWRAAYRPQPVVTRGFALRKRLAEWTEPARRDPRMSGPDEFEFLNVRRRVVDARDWNQPSWPMLWRYQLHYFDDLNAHGFRDRAQWHRDLIERWIAENPAASGAGWDPYPTSLRIVNWIKWWMSGATASNNALQSVRLQLAQVISRLEYHLLGNHLLENSRALIFGGLLFEGRDADRWLNRGLTIMARQLPEQILEDGGHFERSPMYHQITLFGLLDLFNIMTVFDRPERASLESPIRRMLRWLALMCHPDGDIALFNDAAVHEAPVLAGLQSYAARLGIEGPMTGTPAAEEAAVHLKSSGYVRIVRERYTAILNVGSVAPAYQPAHAHADTLSFELSTLGRRLIVDTGTSTYELGPRRSWERGTAAHNTLMLDDSNSSDVWGGFRVARRARILAAAVKADGMSTRVDAAHDGYLHLSARAVHARQWLFGSQQLDIVDRIDGCGEVNLQFTLNIHPDFELVQTSSVRFVVRSSDGRVSATIDTPGELQARTAEFLFAPRFGATKPGARIFAAARLRLPQTLSTRVRFS